MKLGIGGGIGPLRAGVSTRGFGVGVGPLHASSGWGGKKRSRSRSSSGSGSGWGTLIGAAIVLALVWAALAWPYWAATAVARKNGVATGSGEYIALGWTAEGVWLALLLGITFLVLVKVRRHPVDRSDASDQSTPPVAESYPPAPTLHVTPPPAPLPPVVAAYRPPALPAGFRQAPQDAPGLLRWWDGQRWTERRKWSTERVGPKVTRRLTSSGATYFAHHGCAVRHRSEDAAHRCRSV